MPPPVWVCRVSPPHATSAEKAGQLLLLTESLIARFLTLYQNECPVSRGLGEPMSAVPIFNQPTELDLREFADLSLNLLCIAGTDGYFKYLNPIWETALG